MRVVGVVVVCLFMTVVVGRSSGVVGYCCCCCCCCCRNLSYLGLFTAADRITIYLSHTTHAPLAFLRLLHLHSLPSFLFPPTSLLVLPLPPLPSSFLFQWVSPGSLGAKVDGFEIRWIPSDATPGFMELQDDFNVIKTDGDTHECVITDLFPATDIDTAMRAHNIAGWGSWSRFEGVRTADEEPNGMDEPSILAR